MLDGRLVLVTIEGRMPYASNTTLLARDGDGEPWVYKPEQGENPLWDFEWKTLAAREVLTFEVATGLGLDLVPETVLAEGPLGPGSAQRFVNEDFDFDPRPLFSPNLDRRLWPVAVLDLICNNADRKVGHVIRDKSADRLWAIDHGLTFHREPKLRTVLWGFAGEVIPSPLFAAVAGLRSRLAEGLSNQVERLLSTDEARALELRVARLLEDPVHPHPPTDRPAVPWPVY
ncbi:MAG: SCO1664 family protein [Acidimicrobiia bacterium]